MGLISLPSYAAQCWNRGGQYSSQPVNLDITQALGIADNQVGKVVTAFANIGLTINAVCQPENNTGVTYRSYILSNPQQHYIVDRYNKVQMLYFNEYINGGLEILSQGIASGNGQGVILYPPVGNVMTTADLAVSQGRPFMVQDHFVTLYIKIKKPFVGKVPMPTSRLIDVYIRTNPVDMNQFSVYNISFTGYVEAKQSCDINANQVVRIDFGDISANAFKGLAIGEKPASVEKITRQVAVQCTNVDAQAILTLSLESTNSSGEIMKSNNADIGFKLSDMNNRVLIPNNINSNISFTMQQNPMNISFNAWPVSLTGKTPTVLGPFSSTGLLRVDYQ